MQKKTFLTESVRKQILADKEKSIIENFAKNFNKIKRINEDLLPDIPSEESTDPNIQIGDVFMLNGTHHYQVSKENPNGYYLIRLEKNPEKGTSFVKRDEMNNLIEKGSMVKI